MVVEIKGKKLFTLLDLCVSSLRRGHANLLCIVPILTDDPRRESDDTGPTNWSVRVNWVCLREIAFAFLGCRAVSHMPRILSCKYSSGTDSIRKRAVFPVSLP